MAFQILKRSWISVPKPGDLKEYVGRFVQVKLPDGNKKLVEIERIMGSVAYPTRFEIVSKGEHYHIIMVDFFAQMNGEYISDEDVKAFDEQQFLVKRNAWKKSKSGLIVKN